jgi:hypothetical protein
MGSHLLILDLTVHTIGVLLRNVSPVTICSRLFPITALFIIAGSQKGPRSPSTDKLIQKMYIYTVEYYVAIKNNGFMKFLNKWMNLEDIILSEVILSQKNNHDMHSLIRKYSYMDLNTQGTIHKTH